MKKLIVLLLVVCLLAGGVLGFLLGTGLKLTASGVMLFYIIKFL